MAGVTVYRDTRLVDVPAVLAAHKAVTLVAHWRFLNFDAPDVLDLVGFRKRLAASEGLGEPENEFDARRPVNVLLRDDPGVCAADNPADLAMALNRLMLPSEQHYQWRPGDGEPPADMASAAGLTRVLLEEMFPGCFAPGLCLELADRLCTAWEFIDRVPDAFDGVLDLTVCNSLILAEAVHRKRPRCTALSNVKPATIDTRLVIYRHVIRALSHTAEPFEDVMARAHISLLRQIRRMNEPT